MINWSAKRYVATLAELLTSEVEGLRVAGLTEQRDPPALDRTLVEVEIERFEGQATGMAGTLDAELYASLVLSVRCAQDDSELALVDLVLEVATVLQAIRDQGALGPTQVLSVEPEPLDDTMEKRLAAWRIRYSQQLRIERLGVSEDSAPYRELWASRAPEIGPAHRDEYERLVPLP